MENKFIQKIPLNPPLPKGEDTRKDSRQAGMTKETKINFIDTPQLAVGRFIRFYCGYFFWIFEYSLKRVEGFIYPIVKITGVVL
jgi:hypothetical protein